MDDNSLTPQGISTASFATKAKEYETLSESISTKEGEVALAEFELKEFLGLNGFDELAEGEKLTNLRTKIKVFKPEEVDQAKTDTLRAEYSAKVTKLVANKIALERVRSQLGDVKSYISFLKEIANIAVKSTKPGQQDQKPQ